MNGLNAAFDVSSLPLPRFFLFHGSQQQSAASACRPLGGVVSSPSLRPAGQSAGNRNLRRTRERTRDGTDAKWKHIQPIGGNNRQAFIPEGGTQISIPDRLCKSQQTLKAAGF